jgi:hypothetical protein
MVTKVNETNFQQTTLNTFSLMPKLATITYASGNTASTAGGQTIVINGVGFNAGISILINKVPVGVVTRVNYTRLTFVTPPLPAGTYSLYAVNTDGGWSILEPGIVYA